jgi:hypothetical protein
VSHANWLARAVSIQDSVCLLKDVREQVPSPIPGIDSDKMSSEWASGLIGYALNANVNMKVVHLGINTDAELDSCQLIFHQDAGVTSEDLARRLAALIKSGRTVVNLLADSLSVQMGVGVPSQNISGAWVRRIAFLGTKSQKNIEGTSEVSFKVLASPLFEYSLTTRIPPAGQDRLDCFPVLKSGIRSVNGYGCAIGQGTFYQLGALFYDVINSDDYVRADDIQRRTQFLRDLLQDQNISPRISVAVEDHLAKVVAFGRQVPLSPEFWITAKSGRESPVAFRVRVRDAEPEKIYLVRDLLSNHEENLSGQALKTEGFDAKLDGLGSTVYWIEPAAARAARP